MAFFQQLLPAGIKRAVRERVLRGDTVWCPVCERGAIAFLPAGTPPRPHALCPFCYSLERTRMMWLFLRRQGIPQPGMRVLHVAPEHSLFRRFVQLPGITYIAGDKHEPGYQWPAGTIDLDITALSFPDAHFDLVICSHVLEHVPDDRAALRELHRVLKPGGTGLLLVPYDRERASTFEDATVTDAAERLRLFGQHDHVRIYGRDHLDRMREAGFTVDLVDLTDGMDPRDVFRLGLRRGEAMQVVSR